MPDAPTEPTEEYAGASLKDLPDDVLIIIFTFLARDNALDLVPFFTMNQRMRRLVLTPEVWRDVRIEEDFALFDADPGPLRPPPPLRKVGPWIQSLERWGCDPEATLTTCGRFLPNVEQLKLESWAAGSVSVHRERFLAQLNGEEPRSRPSCDNLSVLCLQDVMAPISGLISFLQDTPNLRFLHLRNSLVDDRGRARDEQENRLMIEDLPTLTNMLGLIIEGTWIWCYEESIVASFPNLRMLEITSVIGDFYTGYLAVTIAQRPQLEILVLHVIEGELAREMARWVGRCNFERLEALGLGLLDSWCQEDADVGLENLVRETLNGVRLVQTKAEWGVLRREWLDRQGIAVSGW